MGTSKRSVTLAGVLLATGLAFGSGAAWAEPQALALVATGGTIDLSCEGPDCGAEFSTFCLQPDRFSPVQGTKYVLAGGGEVRVSATTRDGREIALDAGRYLRFVSMRSHLALRISISREQMEALDIAKVSVAVGENVSLLAATAVEDGAYDEAELATLTGSLRALGSRIVDGNEERMAAARVTNRLINAMPASGGAGGGAQEALWRRAVAEAEGQGLPGQALKLARNAYELCDFVAIRESLGSMRRCLQSHHDGFVNFLNSDYWKAVKTGS